ncbi:ABC transporter ATP-binding protein [Paraburkholderia solisilvae]|uniref:Aliphatic sulfonates import ATP-binding protein SsuB n=1 Tax=Paraburkholderia solisilvae TaxID=624376 RepID=A0A6J5DME5_9BURK|nr:ABC transporter ATP-binding protein [Paraburkholderia solisilvae]CAB3753996.1 Aliphatic sulfonates import ATP-binding protein SsuB [Paraburkholderia solisilvae]
MIAPSSPHDAHPLLDVAIDAKRFGERMLLAGTRLSVARGEIVSLVGASGCGKSTLLRIVAGLDRDFAGTIMLDGAVQHGPSPQSGVIFQEPRLLPWLSVADNVSFPARARGACGARVDRLLDEVGLAGTGRLWPKHLSGGMAQRVALARGLFTQPRLLLLDEPFSAVDAITKMRLQDLLLSITRAHRTAALMVTHDLDEALYLSDRVLLMAAPDSQRAARIVREFAVDAPRPRTRDMTFNAALRADLFASLEALVPA